MLTKRAKIGAIASVIAVVGLVLGFLFVWVWGQGINKKNFEDLYNAGIEVQTALNVGVNRTEFARLVRQLWMEEDKAKRKVRNIDEEQLLFWYRQALYEYDKSLEIWDAKISISVRKAELVAAVRNAVTRPVNKWRSRLDKWSKLERRSEVALQDRWLAARGKMDLGEGIYDRGGPTREERKDWREVKRTVERVMEMEKEEEIGIVEEWKFQKVMSDINLEADKRLKAVEDELTHPLEAMYLREKAALDALDVIQYELEAKKRAKEKK